MTETAIWQEIASRPCTVECVRIYANGETRVTHWSYSEAAEWLEYNRKFRPGNALFMNGLCRAYGYFSKAKCAAIEQMLGEHKEVIPPDDRTREYYRGFLGLQSHAVVIVDGHNLYEYGKSDAEAGKAYADDQLAAAASADSNRRNACRKGKSFTPPQRLPGALA